MLIEKKNFTSNNLLNLLIATIPFSLILGNLAININIIFICFLGIIIFKLETFKINKKIYSYLIYSFFAYLILITLYNNLPNINDNYLYKEHIIKSFLFLRFLILFLVVNKLVEKNLFNINLFFISCAFFAMAVSMDLIVQVILKKNILINPLVFQPSTFFGVENIAGGYLQKFSLFFIILIVSLVKKNKLNLYSNLLFMFFLIPILLTGNRMPLILYIFSAFIFFTLQKKIKETFLFLVFTLLIIFFSIKYFPGGRLSNTLKNFYTGSKIIITQFINLNQNDELFKNKANATDTDARSYILHYNTAIEIWKENKFFGSGLKSFRLKCTYETGNTCNSHPHNYILEILVDTGVLGFILIYLIFIFSIFDFFKFYRHNFGLNLQLFSIPFFLIVFLEFFPLRSSGSFFTTNNATVIFIMVAFLISISSLQKSKVK